VEIERLGPGDEERVVAASHLFDEPATYEWAHEFFVNPGHHLLVATVDGTAAGFVSGVEMTHPDKGTEMLLYELGVDDAFQRQGIGRALVEALAAVAKEEGCYGMWVLTDHDNEAAIATYTRGGATASDPQVLLEWSFTGDPAADG
jgi:ribosomal protein S18 acetylase RimI-like enzyme